MKVLVTGGVGFIGSHVAKYYAEKGHEVVAFDNLSRAEILRKVGGNQLYNLNYLKNRYSNVTIVKGDVRRFEEVELSSKDVNTIVHTAAQVAVTTSLNDPRLDFEINALGTFNVLEVARLNDAALILCSTNKVYGENINKIATVERRTRYAYADPKYKNGIPENFPIDLCGHSPYGCSKLTADLYAQDYFHTYGLKIGVFRLSCIYGDRQFGVEDQGWLSWFIIATLTAKPINIYGDGKQVRDVLYVSDLVKVFDRFLESNLRHDVFNIGGGPEFTLSLLELLNLIEQYTSVRPKLSFSSWRPADQKVYISDISKAKKKLSWNPVVNPKVGVKNLINWVQENKHLLH